MHPITRAIGIDMGHRVPTQGVIGGSKCRNLHGHRYQIELTVDRENLNVEGGNTDMVIDFGFLKEALMKIVDAYHDHGMTLYQFDPYVNILSEHISSEWIEENVAKQGYAYIPGNLDVNGSQTKLVIVPFIPTAERLAQFWFERLRDYIYDTQDPSIKVINLRVYETPNGWVDYPGN
jgi:6-pyruvoyltetrahydropterin/6-carboxytetrahydropterin synthase